MEFQSGSLDFSKPLSGGSRNAEHTVVFGRQVKAATAGITGYVAEYSGHGDNHVGSLEVRLDTSISANTVTVKGTLGVRDWDSGGWDDAFDGNIAFVVVAELESAKSPPPRGDLMITGMELNQAVQFFRSNQFLDGETVRPDNSIFLIAGKNTGVRVYVDWDSAAGLPPISQLTGELVVSTASATKRLVSINPGSAIVPKRDSNINQGLPNDTLNFMIPASLSAGTVTVTCHVFDQANPASKSAGVTRTLLFTPVAPLRILTVGVNTTNPPGAAPARPEIAAALSTLAKMFPRTVQVTGFLTIDEHGPFLGSSSGFDSVNDQLEDLRGDSTDVFFGAVPAGFACMTGASGGSSWIGSSCAAALVDSPTSIAHEIGHALGRKHPPCLTCGIVATDVDSQYPQYGNFNSDSIGVFGFDPGANTVFDPAAILDFMSAIIDPHCGSGMTPSFDPQWISPYTYRGLLGNTLGGSSDGAAHQFSNNAETLFLGLTIGRDRKVTRRHAFHYPAPPQRRAACATAFTYEFLGKDGAVLDCGVLHCRCKGGSCECWPKTIRDALAMPGDARSFVVWEGDRKIYEEAIPDPPRVRTTDNREEAGGVRIAWDSDSPDVWYAVHWKDERDGSYRGVAPRQRETSLLVPSGLFTRGPRLEVRVYATSGIATGVVTEQLTPERFPIPGVEIALRTSIPMGAVDPSYVLSALVTDAAGGQIAEQLVAWYNERGAELARGSEIDLRTLAFGEHVLRVVARSFGGYTVGRSWLVETSSAGTVVHEAIVDPPLAAVPLVDHVHPHGAPPPELK